VTIDWAEVFGDLVEGGDRPSSKAPPRPSVQCLCGRFSRYLGVDHGFNGNYATETMTVDCSRCGVVTIELV